MGMLVQLTLDRDLFHRTDSEEPIRKKGDVISFCLGLSEVQSFVNGNLNLHYYIEPGIFARLDITWFYNLRINFQNSILEGSPDVVRNTLDSEMSHTF
jgi:hypothetical protein